MSGNTTQTGLQSGQARLAQAVYTERLNRLRYGLLSSQDL